jgi:hypothetical protein
MEKRKSRAGPIAPFAQLLHVPGASKCNAQNHFCAGSPPGFSGL